MGGGYDWADDESIGYDETVRRFSALRPVPVTGPPNRLRHWWRHLHCFDVWRARDWQTVILLGITSMLLGAAYTIARFSANT